MDLRVEMCSIRSLSLGALIGQTLYRFMGNEASRVSLLLPQIFLKEPNFQSIVSYLFVIPVEIALKICGAFSWLSMKV